MMCKLLVSVTYYIPYIDSYDIDLVSVFYSKSMYVPLPMVLCVKISTIITVFWSNVDMIFG